MPVILCTGLNDHIDGQDAQKLGASDFMIKPFMVEELFNTIRRILDGMTTEAE